ncbi:hypothetical protein GCM10009734_24190 [Nonomuraea bangladeshensis]
MPSALLIVNLGAPIRSRAGTDIETAGYAGGRVVTVTQTDPRYLFVVPVSPDVRLACL